MSRNISVVTGVALLEARIDNGTTKGLTVLVDNGRVDFPAVFANSHGVVANAAVEGKEDARLRAGRPLVATGVSVQTTDFEAVREIVIDQCVLECVRRGTSSLPNHDATSATANTGGHPAVVLTPLLLL
jgi:hypothetical protein